MNLLGGSRAVRRAVRRYHRLDRSGLLPRRCVRSVRRVIVLPPLPKVANHYMTNLKSSTINLYLQMALSQFGPKDRQLLTPRSTPHPRDVHRLRGTRP